MLILYAVLFISALSTTLCAGHPSTTDALTVAAVKSKRGIVEPDRDIGQNSKFHRSKGSDQSGQSFQSDNSNPVSGYKNVKADTQRDSPIGQTHQSYRQKPSNHYDDVFVQSVSHAGLPSAVRQHESRQSNERPAPYVQNPFGSTGDYKAANNAKPVKQINSGGKQPIQRYESFNFSPDQNSYKRDAAIGIRNEAQSSNAHVPVYKTNYPAQRPADYSQLYGSNFQTASPFAQSFESLSGLNNNGVYGAGTNANKVSLPIIQLQNNQRVPSYLHTAPSQPLVLSPVLDNRRTPIAEFNFGTGTGKSNIVQGNTPFLSPFSSIQGQVVPIQTHGSSPQFPQYKGASLQVYPTGVFPHTPVTYESVQPQPLLHFGNVPRIQPVNPQNTYRQFTPAQEIRTDVEIIDKKKPTTPPPSKDDDDDDSDDVEYGHRSSDKEYDSNSREGDDHEYRSGKRFQETSVEGDFKPSKSFPSKQYDEIFGKYTKQKHSEETEEKPLTNYRDYFPTNNDDDNEEISSKFRSEDGPSYDRYEDENEEEDGSRKHERLRKPEGNSDYGRKSRPYRYYDKDS